MCAGVPDLPRAAARQQCETLSGTAMRNPERDGQDGRPVGSSFLAQRRTLCGRNLNP